LSDDRSAVLLVRVWLEDGSIFRARLTSPRRSEDDQIGDDVTVAVTSSPGDTLSAVGDWLDRFIHAAQYRIDGER
jgi:hypothetical protein